MPRIDIDRWNSEPDLVARVEAAARRERAQLVHCYFVRLRRWLLRERRAARADLPCTA